MRSVADRDWSVPAGDLKWSCWLTAVHVADDLFAYAAQVAAQPVDHYLPFELDVSPATPPADVLDIMAAGSELLAAAVSHADPAARAWHPWGRSDASGFAAMGITEIAVHTYDIGLGFEASWPPPDDLAAAATARLFPEVPRWPRAGEALLWCTGRIPLGEHARRQANWRWEASVR